MHWYILDDLENIAHLLLYEFRMGSISTNSTSYQGLALANEEEVNLTPEETCIAREKILAFSKR